MEYILIWLIVVLVVNAGFSWIVGYIATQKGRSFGGFFALSFFLSFLVGILAVIAIPRRETPHGSGASSQFVVTRDGEKAKCPYCAEWVKSEATICKHCGKEIGQKLAELRNNEFEQIQQKQIQNELLAQREAAEAEAKEQERIARRNKFLKSKKGKIVLISTAVLAIFVLTIGSIQLGTSILSQQKLLAGTALEQQSLQKECSIINDRLLEFNYLTQTSSLSAGLSYGDHAVLAQSASERANIQDEVETILPKLIPTDDRLQSEYDELSFPTAVRVADAVLYNQVVEGTSLKQIQNGEITQLSEIPRQISSLYDKCEDITYDARYESWDYTKSWGEAVLVIRQCRISGKLWDTTCN